jgi:hypothetical protein
LSETQSGRTPIILVQIDQDFCQNVYGESPCTAVNPGNKCFNTLATCQDPANYDKGTLTLTFAKPQVDLPKDQNIIPSVTNVTTAPTKINPTNGDRNSAPLGNRAVATVNFTDHPHSDLLVDPYVDGRNYDPLTRGTFWAKWLVRNPFYQNRELRVYEGYIGQEIENMLVRHYFIDAINGPDSNGNVQIVSKDPLKLADRQKAQVPPASPGKLREALDLTVTELDIKNAVEADYDPAGTIRIGDELMTYTTRSIVTISSVDYVRLSGITRGTDNSIIQEHKEDALVQLCVRYTDEKVWEVIYDLLVTYAQIPSQYIPFTDWEDEGEVWLPQFNISTLLSKPEGVGDVLNEIFQQVLAYIWWDERDQEIKFRAIRPLIGNAPTITDDNNIIANSVALSTDPKNRVSQVWVYWDQKNLAEDLTKESNYQQLRIRADLEAESPDQYGEQRIRKIFARWIQNDAQAINLSARLLGASFRNPKILKLRLDAKDRALWTADVVDVIHRNIVDFTGLPESERYQVLSVEEVVPGEVVQYEMQRFIFRGTRFGFYMEADAPNFEDATEEERDGNVAWYADADGRMSDGSLGWEYQ